MRFGIRKPSFKKSFAAKTSLKRLLRQKLHMKAPRGFGVVTSPRKALYNRFYKRTSVSLTNLPKGNMSSSMNSIAYVNKGSFGLFSFIGLCLKLLFFPLILIVKIPFYIILAFNYKELKANELSTRGGDTQ